MHPDLAFEDDVKELLREHEELARMLLEDPSRCCRMPRRPGSLRLRFGLWRPRTSQWLGRSARNCSATDWTRPPPEIGPLFPSAWRVISARRKVTLV
jgi:hypothetical protein